MSSESTPYILSLQKNLEKVVIAVNSEHKEIWWRQYPPLYTVYSRREPSDKINNEIFHSEEFVLYLHIPFCGFRCSYCDYYSYSINDIRKIDSSVYVKSLIKELEYIARNKKGKKLLSVYFGGGTPSLLLPDHIRLLMKFIKNNFNLEVTSQITIEVAPTYLTKNMSRALVESGVNRISLGVQSFNERKLKSVNRRQNNDDVYRAVNYLRQAGHKNINIDLIYGLIPGEHVNDFLEDNLEHLKKIQFNGINIYPLQNYKIFPNTIYNFPAENADKLAEKINTYLNKNKARRSIPLNTALRGSKEGIRKTDFLLSSYDHYYYYLGNLFKDVIAVGFGGVSGFWIKNGFILRRSGNKSLADYIKNSIIDNLKYEYLSLSHEESIRKLIISSLWSGINLTNLRQYFPSAIDSIYKKLKGAENLTVYTKDRVRLRTDFSAFLPFKTGNQLVNYFIMTYCYFYSRSAQKELLRKTGVIK